MAPALATGTQANPSARPSHPSDARMTKILPDVSSFECARPGNPQQASDGPHVAGTRDRPSPAGSALEQGLRPLHHVVDGEAVLAQQRVGRSGSAEAVDAQHVAVLAGIATPA